MTRASVEALATHFRLKPETWALIAAECRNGATARDIGARWKVAPSSVYRHACADGWTKKGMGDARARAHARMVEEEEASVRSMQPVGSRALKALFPPAPADDASATDPAALSKAAPWRPAGRVTTTRNGEGESGSRRVLSGSNSEFSMANIGISMISRRLYFH